MSDGSNIQWTDATWNPVAGCSKVSEGCRNCYAMKDAARVAAAADTRPAEKRTAVQRAYGQVVKRGPRGFPLPQWNNEVVCIPERLGEPLKWRRPRRIFVNSMSDLFHEKVPFEFIDQVFAVMALCPQHTFQVLTKRPERMAEYMSGGYPLWDHEGHWPAVADDVGGNILCVRSITDDYETVPKVWPLPNVWLGASVENQAAAVERIPHLLRCPAAVRFLSCEPLLGPLNIVQLLGDLADEHDWIDAHQALGECESCDGSGFRDYLGSPDEWGEDCPSQENHLIACRDCDELRSRKLLRVAAQSGLHWVIIGGESGDEPRAFHASWAKGLIDQCRAASVPVFVKQLGRFPAVDKLPATGRIEHACCLTVKGGDAAVTRTAGENPWLLYPRDEADTSAARSGWVEGASLPDGWLQCRRMKHPKGGDPAEWPEDLRIREYPTSVQAGSEAHA